MKITKILLIASSLTILTSLALPFYDGVGLDGSSKMAAPGLWVFIGGIINAPGAFVRPFTFLINKLSQGHYHHLMRAIISCIRGPVLAVGMPILAAILIGTPRAMASRIRMRWWHSFCMTIPLWLFLQYWSYNHSVFKTIHYGFYAWTIGWLMMLLASVLRLNEWKRSSVE